MLRISLVMGMVLMASTLLGQVFWTEDFGAGPCAESDPVDGFDSGNGAWSAVLTPGGINGAQNNVWYVSAAEAGMGEGNCGDGCLDDAALDNKSLHVSTDLLGDLGAAYVETGMGITTTDLRAISPVIDCSDQTDVVLDFLYLTAGAPPNDICMVEYSIDGVAWSNLGILAPTPLGCAPQGTWTAVSFNLPASADDNANVQLAFRWMNTDDGVATDPSVAIDDITLSGTTDVVAEITAAFSASLTDICVGDCIDFTDESVGDGINDWEWTFTGAETGTSTDQNPAGICYETAGSYPVTLSITSPDADDVVTVNAYITVSECGTPPTAAFSAAILEICEGDCVGFTDESTGGNITDWQWTFTGADTPASTDQNPAGICYATAGNYDVSLSVTNDLGTDDLTETNYITVIVCAGPTANFETAQTDICAGDCIDFSNLSIGGATTFDWTFEGADTPTSAVENPVGICYSTPGTYDVTLFVSDGTQDDIITLTDYITVEDCTPAPELIIGASAQTICKGACVDFEDLSGINNIDTWSWIFNGGDPAVSSVQDPLQVCYLNQGSFDVTLLVDINGTLVDSTFANFITVVDSCGPVANFNYTPIMCYGQCYSFENTSTGGDTYFWTFEGAATPTSEEENPEDICYLNSTGTFNVTLTVLDQFGSSTSITQQVIVVPPTTVNAGPDQTITQGTTTTLSATVGGNGSGEFIWQPFESVTAFDQPSTQTVPLQETTQFIVYYEQSGGCVSSDTVMVFIDEEVLVGGVPNSFSPNGDGTNDILYVRGNNITAMKLIIYNRYGQEVFSTTDQKMGWDGTRGGRALNGGVFGYYLEASFADGTRSVQKGDITLVR